ncbi:hypothetical protein KCTC32516_02249 [Polaribacter huanghezhanensis]|uniref:DUF1573 domain-containing protein n=1 Tax=Polaribacter huanghezhanensis TaxID=1354726 RepID=UPI002649FC2B|nr:DUF1573 domain-containing protein [Polaribacter huanghezhanensis]WKD86869.1 hypothetical protein KCTC32516_02249 [Polaribacter huanghezhanensis]
MRKIIIFSLAVSLGILTACSGGNAAAKVDQSKLADAKKRDMDISKGAPVISLDKKEFDFGTVTDGDIIETTFIVTNTGKSPLIITDAKTTCGCTVPTWPKDKPIAPGESTEIAVKFNTNGKGGGRQVKDVTLFTNTAVGREILRIKGIVNKKK